MKKHGYWTKEKCIESAEKYISKTEWRDGETGAYLRAIKSGWINECTQHMNLIRIPKGYWTKEKCIDEARKYDSKREWNKKNPDSYRIALYWKWTDDCCAHMKTPISQLTDDELLIEAKKYESKKDLYLGNKSLYGYILSKNLMNIICETYGEKYKPHHIWTKEECIEDVRKYKTKYEWSKMNGAAYATAKRNRWLDEMLGYFAVKDLPKDITKEMCIEDAKKCKTKLEWRRDSIIIFNFAKKMNWFEEATQHMFGGKWTKEACIEDAKKYKTKTFWRHMSLSAYTLAYKNGWIEDCVAHMEK